MHVVRAAQTVRCARNLAVLILSPASPILNHYRCGASAAAVLFNASPSALHTWRRRTEDDAGAPRIVRGSVILRVSVNNRSKCIRPFCFLDTISTHISVAEGLCCLQDGFRDHSCSFKPPVTKSHFCSLKHRTQMTKQYFYEKLEFEIN